MQLQEVFNYKNVIQHLKGFKNEKNEIFGLDFMFWCL